MIRRLSIPPKSTSNWLSVLFVCVLLIFAPIALTAATEKTTQDHLYPFALGNNDYAEPANGPRIAYYEDVSATKVLEDIIQLSSQSNSFILTEEESISFTNTTSAYWFHFSAKNTEDIQKTWYARIGYPLLDEIEFNTLRISGINTVHTGDSRPFNTRLINDQYFIFPIQFEPRETVDIYVRVLSGGAITFPIEFTSAGGLFSDSTAHNLLQGIHYGTLIILCIYNALLFFYTGSRSYLYNAFYMASLSLFIFSVSGLSFQYFWPDNPQFANTIIPLSEGLVILSMALFSRVFLYTSPEQTKTYHAINVITVFGGTICLLSVFLPYYLAVKLGTILAIISIVVIYSISIGRLSEGYQPAKAFVLAWTIFMAGAFVYALAIFGFISGEFIQQYIIRIATGAQVIFINVALAMRVRYLNDQLIASDEKTKQALETQVAERTIQLHKANEKLSQLNSTLQEISNTDELTQIYNRRYFNDVLDELIKMATREKKPISLLIIDIDHFKAVNDSYGHFVGDACLKHVAQMITQNLSRPSDFCARYGGEEFAVVLPNTDMKGAKLVANKIIESLRHCPATVDDINIKLTVSVGATTQTPTDYDPAKLIVPADDALYNAKSTGRDRLVTSQNPS